MVLNKSPALRGIVARDSASVGGRTREQRRAIARLIDGAFPTTEQIADWLMMKPHRVRYLLNFMWFESFGGQWQLTEAGRKDGLS